MIHEHGKNSTTHNPLPIPQFYGYGLNKNKIFLFSFNFSLKSVTPNIPIDNANFVIPCVLEYLNL